MVVMESLRRSGEDTAWITQQARTLSFDACGVVRADRFPELDHFSDWLRRGYAGEMHYLEDSRRADVRAAMPHVRSAIVCLLNYNTNFPLSLQRATTEECRSDPPRGWISRYAWGDDYHDVLWDKLNRLVARLPERFVEEHTARAYADTGPISERVLARHAGLGWIGKNTLLLNQKFGSWFFLGAILTSLDLEPSVGPDTLPPPNLCGSCRKCIDACPTAAFVEPYVLDARRCISYLTIELRGSIPEEHRREMGTHVFGCDICQDVCPWNRKAPVTERGEFTPRKLESDRDGSLFEPRLEWLISLSEEEFRTVFRRSPVKRAKWRGLVRNACVALGNMAPALDANVLERVVALLEKHARGTDSVVAESARWALSRIQRSAAAPDKPVPGEPGRPVEPHDAPDV